MSRLLAALVSFTSFFFISLPVRALEDFHSSIKVDYSYDTTGESQVRQQVSLTNLRSSVYATSYQLEIQGESPKGITGYDAGGPLKITTTAKSQDTTVVDVTFNEQVVGKNKTLVFNLIYSGKPALHKGQVWEVGLPKLANADFADEYELNLFVPNSFGRPAYISPPPSTSDTSLENQQKYTFRKEGLLQAGVVAAFGNFQTFGFRLSYQLGNTSGKQQLQKLALPPDTAYQRVFYDTLDPKPLSLEIDQDGNWLASYRLKHNENLEVVASGQAHLLSQPIPGFTPTSVELSSKPMHADTYWPVDDPAMVQLANTLKTPEAIYHYVVDKLSYDYSLLSPQGTVRKGAAAALSTPTRSLCTEFTDLFITLARAAKIPAREVNGYAYTQDPKLQPLSLEADVLHAWPEYWDVSRGVWIGVDPTWEKTTGGIDYFSKFDFNHFAFVIHGQSSTQPLSAGLYKSDPSQKLVSVQLDQYKEYQHPGLNVGWKSPWQFLPFITNRSFLEINNPAGFALYRVPVNVVPLQVELASSSQFQIAAIPPFSKTLVPLDFKKSVFPDFSSKSVSVSVGDQVITYNLKASSFNVWHVGYIFIISLTLICVAVVAGHTWSLYLQRREGRSPLRR